MNTFDKCKRIRGAILYNVGTIINYGWDNEFATQQLKGLPERIMDVPGGMRLLRIDPCKLTKHQMIELGFAKWKRNSQLMLIPLWMHPFLVDEFPSESVNTRKRITKRSDMDARHTYGVFPAEAPVDSLGGKLLEGDNHASFDIPVTNREEKDNQIDRLRTPNVPYTKSVP